MAAVSRGGWAEKPNVLLGYAAVVPCERQEKGCGRRARTGDMKSYFPGPQSRERAGQLPIDPPHSHCPFGVVSLHFFILWPSDRSDRLVFCCASRNLFLNGITDIHQHLSEAAEPLSSFPGVCGNGTMRRHEDLCPQAFDRIQPLQPVEAVTVVDI